MGITEVTVEITNPRDQTQWQTVSLVAATGAIFSVIPKGTLEQLVIKSYAEETFFLADGSEIHRQLGRCLSLHRREIPHRADNIWRT